MPTFNVPGLGVNATGGPSTLADVSVTTITAYVVAENVPVVLARGGPAIGNFQSSDAGQTNKYTFGRDNASTGDFVWAFNGTRRGGFTSTGVLAWGTTVTTGAGPGNIVLPNGIGYCSANAAGTSILALLNADSSNRTVLRTNGVRLVVATALTSVSAPSNGTAAAPPTNPYAYLLANVAGQDVGIPMYIL